MSILTERRIWRRAQLAQKFERELKASRQMKRRLTDTEQANVRHAVRCLVFKLGTRTIVAIRAGMTPDALRKASSVRRRQSMRLAVAIAYVAGVDVETILSGKWPEACPLCGRGS
jgi:hypothetical protein